MTKFKSTSTAELRRLTLSRGGYTLAEVAVAAAIMAIVMPVLAMLFTSTNTSFTGFEASNSLKINNQNTVNRMYLRLGRNKRLFQNTAADTPFLSSVGLSGSPSVMSGSKLPVIEIDGSVSPGTADFHPGSFGNSLFLAYNDKALELSEISDSASSTTTVRVDTYKFSYYYLTPDGSPEILGRQTYKVVEWESVPYADCDQLNNIANSTKRYSTVSALLNQSVNFCWSPSANSTTVAFSSFTRTSPDTGAITSSPLHTIQKHDSVILTKLTTGIMGSGYMYGISPNAAAGDGSFKKTVPAYATASGQFPAGLEIGVTGSSSGRQVLIRSVMIAKGSVMKMMADEEVAVCSARDIW